jgi:hypothetical protein
MERQKFEPMNAKRAATTVSPNIPDKLKMAIGDAVRMFSLIDSCALEIVWLVAGADLAMKMKLAKEHSANNLKTLERAIRQIPRAETDAIWQTCRDLLDERNLIAHGVWMVDQDGIPQVTWHSRFLESEDYAVVHQFP